MSNDPYLQKRNKGRPKTDNMPLVKKENITLLERLIEIADNTEEIKAHTQFVVDCYTHANSNVMYQYNQQKGDKTLQSLFSYLMQKKMVTFVDPPEIGDILFAELRGMLIGAHLVRAVDSMQIATPEKFDYHPPGNLADYVAGQLAGKSPLYLRQQYQRRTQGQQYQYRVHVYGQDECYTTWYAIAKIKD